MTQTDMQNFVVVGDAAEARQIICENRSCPGDSSITSVYSIKHAHDLGWRFYRAIKSRSLVKCSPFNPWLSDLEAYCPSCSKNRGV